MQGSIVDIPGIKVGHYTNLDAARGCTVILCESGAVAGVDIRGSAPGTRETDLLRPTTLVQCVHAIVVSGGSAFGLDAAAGVMRYLEEKGIGYDTPAGKVPIVPAAVIFDLDTGDPRVRPGPTEGYKACLDASDSDVAEGCVGAGTGATVGKVLGIERATKSGLGMASKKVAGGVIVGAIAIVNALGDVVDPRTGDILAGTRGKDGKSFVCSAEIMKQGLSWGNNLPPNTTVVVIATNARLNKEQVNKVAQMAHDGMARAINPCHTMYDGDTVFALSLGQHQCDVNIIGTAAADVAADAIVRAVMTAWSLAGRPARDSIG